MAAKIKIKWNSERILSLSAMSISFITLLIFIYQTNLMSKQNYLSILPYIELATSDSAADKTYSLNLKNHGVGPAILESVILEYNGRRYDLKDYDDYLFNVLISIAPELDSIESLDASTLNKGMAIPANTTYMVLSVSDSEKDYNLLTNALYSIQKGGLRYEIVYRSLQNERWTINQDDDGPIKLD